MNIKERCARLIAVVATLANLSGALGGCGDDDDAKPQAVSGAGGGKATLTTLPGHTAGKACSADKECDRGACSKQLSSGNTLLGGTTMIDAPGGYCTATCSVTADCGDGGSCVLPQAGLGGFTIPGAAGAPAPAASTSGTCYATCATTSDCREGYRCMSSLGQPIAAATGVNGTCQAAPPTDKLPDAIVGKTCSADGECSGGSCMTTMAGNMFGGAAASFPGGYCTGRCLADADCGATGVCDLGLGGVSGTSGTCYLKCESDSDCGRDGYRCRAAAGAGLIPGQTASTSKQCTPGAAPLPSGVVGNACSSDAQCGAAANSCKTQLMSQFGGTSTTLPDGYCTATCVDSSDCGTGGVCAGGFGGVVSGNCYKKCAANTDCRTGYSCGMPSSGIPGGAMGFPGGGMLPGASTDTVCTPTAPVTTPDQDAGTP